MNVSMYIKSLFWKKDDAIVLFGSWFGDRFADTTRYLYQYVSENKEKLGFKNVVWVTRKNDICNMLNSMGYECYMMNSKEALYYHKVAKYHIISNTPLDDGDIKGDDKGVRTKSWTKTHGHREKCILKNNNIEHWKFMKKPNLLRKQFRGWAILRGDRLYTIGSTEKDYSQRKNLLFVD